MSISSRITEMETHIGNIYDTLEVGGADLTNVNKNILNIDAQLKDRYLDYLNNGTDEIWNNWEKVTATNVNEATLNNTVEAPMKIDLKGNTFQQTYIGKNLANYLEAVLYDTDRGTISSTNTGFSYQITSQTGTGVGIYIPINIIAGEQYTINYNISSGVRIANLHLQENINDKTYQNIGTSMPLTFTSTYNAKYIRFYINNSTYSGADIGTISNIMINSGSTAQDFEPYVGGIPSPNPDYSQTIHNVSGNNNIKIQNKNLFDGEWTGSTSTNFIQVFAGKSYIYSEQNSATAMNYRFYESASSSNYIQSYVAGGNAYTPSQDGYIKLYKTSTTKTQCQLEQGTTATTYVAHQEQNLLLTLGDIELNKIDTAEDYFYKENGKWFLHKEIGKTVFDENTTYTYFSAGSSDTTNAYRLKPIEDIKPYTLYTQAPEMKNTKFSAVPQSASWNPGDVTRLRNNPKVIVFLIEKSQTADDLKNILNGEPLYYVLETPTNTEITDATLISQLEVLLQAKSYNDQTNVTQTNNDLPFKLDITALKNS